MKVEVQQLGNDVAIRVPNAFAEYTKITQGSVVALSVVEGKLVAAPVRHQLPI